MTAGPRPAGAGGGDSIEVLPASGDRRQQALAVLLSQPDSDLAVAYCHGMADFADGSDDALFLALVDQRPAGVVAVTQLPGAVASIWPPVLLGRDERRALLPTLESLENALLGAALRHATALGAVLVQCIFPPGAPVGAALERSGVPFVTELEFRERTLWSLPPRTRQLASVPFQADRRQEFVDVLERTSLASLDCPSLCESGDWSLVLNRQRQPSGFEPEFWRLYYEGDRPAGIMLSNPSDNSAVFEVSYVGIVPEFRGQRLGHHVLLDGLCRLQHSGGKIVRLSVDVQNRFARRTYDGLGFDVQFRKRVHGRRLVLVEQIEEIDRL